MEDLLFGEYESLGPLGHGAYADVYKVRHKKLEYIRAIKVLKGFIESDQDEQYLKFLDECKLLLRLGNGSQDNIVNIARPRLLYNHALVEMEYIQGCDFDKYIKESCEGFVPIEEVLGLLEDIGSALAYCHYDIYKYCISPDDKCYVPNASGILEPREKSVEELVSLYKVLHNDIHSKNIMRRDDGKYMLLDFGLALAAGGGTKSSARNAGAPEYKPPEKWNNNDLLSEQSDIYSFGVLMYEALTGVVPFGLAGDPASGEVLFKLQKDHENTKPSPMKPLRKKTFEARYPGKEWEKDYPDWLEVLILKCLAKKPADRYANGKELFLQIKENIWADRQDELAGTEELRDKIKGLTRENAYFKERLTDYDETLNELVASLDEATNNKQPKTAVTGLKKENIILKIKTIGGLIGGKFRWLVLSCIAAAVLITFMVASWLN